MQKQDVFNANKYAPAIYTSSFFLVIRDLEMKNYILNKNMSSLSGLDIFGFQVGYKYFVPTEQVSGSVKRAWKYFSYILD
jgi:hypothetical protein